MDWKVSLVFVSCLVSFLHGEQECESSKLGMEDGSIQDDAITASSYQPGYEPKYGRFGISNKHRESAWCPASKVNTDSYEWLQVDFREMVSITHVNVGGDFGGGIGSRYPRHYRLEYQRGEDDQWIQYVNSDGEQIFPGPANGRYQKLRETDNLLASRVRVIPLSDFPMDVCLRIEFYGCLRNGVASYRVPQGDYRNERYNFIDRKYDSNESEDGILTGGLGLLTDGKTGESDYSISVEHWLGWNSDSRNVVEMIFEMDHLRNISQISFFCNNQRGSDVSIFNRATIYTSRDRAVFTGDSVIVFTAQQYPSENSRLVPVDFGPVVARFVKVVLDFSDKWILISEITFNSHLATGPFPEGETSPPLVIAPVTTTKATRSTTRPITTNSPVDETTPTEVVLNGVQSGDINNAESTQSPGIDGSVIGIIVGSCVGAILVVIFIIIVCCVYQRKKPSNSSTHSYDGAVGTMVSLPSLQKSQHADTTKYDLPWSRPLPHVPDMNGAMTTSSQQTSGYMSVPDGGPYACVPVGSEQYNNYPQHHSQTMSSARNSPCLQHYMTSGGLLTLPGIHHERHNCCNANNNPVNTLPARSNLLIPLPNKGVDGCNLNSYDLVQPDSCSSPFDSSNYRSSPSVLPHIQGTTGNSVYGVHIGLPNSQLEDDLPNIPANSLRFLEKLGAGQYGEVHLCEMTVPTHLENLKATSGGSARLVAVKKLQPTANEATKNDFVREIRIMSKLRHQNIVQVLGVCTDANATDSPSVVTEYMSRGDLHQFLQKHVPEGTTLLNKQALSQSILLHIANQISHGMSYLEQLNVTHRDLAARNCLVGENYQVKISDFGMSRSLYSQQYYKVEGRVVLPIRWMAWESVLLGKFTTKSDVWSFGVTLWEIFSFAREQPFSMMTDDDVIANCMNYYNNNLSEVISLTQPSQCSKEVFDLMKACWQPADFNRPTFKEISLFLQRKSPAMTTHNENTSVTRLTTC